MLKIYDGRNEFYQWDLDQKLIVFNPEINEVHFCNQSAENSLVCEVYNDGGLRVVNVPNILLQDSWPIKAYAHCDCATKSVQTFTVKARTKPSDYVYTETEVKKWDKLNDLLTKIEESGFDFDNLEDFVTEEELDAKGYLTEIPSEYVTDKELEAKGYLTEHQSLDGYAKTTEVSSEKERAELVELALGTRITEETSRATTAEGKISQNLASHISDYNEKVSSLEVKDQSLTETLNTFMARVNALLASDDTTLDELQEIVNYVKNNKTLIEAITTSKVNVSDIIDNLLSTSTNKPLSANQGRVLKGLIDTLTTAYETKIAELTKADSTNATAISNEVSRAKLAEKVNADAITEIKNAGYAKTTDIVNPDYDENDPTSKVHILNRPFYIEGFEDVVISIVYSAVEEFPENTSNVSARLSSNKTYTKDELIGATVVVNNDYDGESTVTITEDHFRDESEEGIHINLGQYHIFVVYTTGYLGLSSVGVYLCAGGNSDNPVVDSISFTAENIKKLDNKFLDLANNEVIKALLARIEALENK